MLVHFSLSVIKRNILFPVKVSTSQCGTGPPVSKYESYLHTFIRNSARLLSTLDNTHTHTQSGSIYASSVWGFEARIPVHVSYCTNTSRNVGVTQQSVSQLWSYFSTLCIAVLQALRQNQFVVLTFPLFLDIL
jgi:hypothetical protein